METKLKSVLQTPYLPLVLNTVFFAFVLLLFTTWSKQWFSTPLFVITSYYLYTKALFKSADFQLLFFVFIAALASTSMLLPNLVYMFNFLFISIWAILIGLERALLVDRFFWIYTLCFLMLFPLITLYLFSNSHVGIPGVFNGLLFMLGITLVLYVFHTQLLPASAYPFFFPIVGALLLFELINVLILLPFSLSFILGLGFLFIVGYMDFMYARRFDRQALIFILFFILVSLTTHWKL